MLLDRYNPNDHDLYTYENDPTNSNTWPLEFTGEDFNSVSDPSLGSSSPAPLKYIKNCPTGYNTNCILPAYSDSSPPFHKVSVNPRRNVFSAKKEIKSNTVKDRFIENNISNWRTRGPNDTDLLADSNTWNSGYAQMVPIANKYFITSRESIETALSRDLEHRFRPFPDQETPANLQMGINYNIFILPNATFFRSQTNDINNIEILQFEFGTESTSCAFGGNAPPVRDIEIESSTGKVLQSISSYYITSVDDLLDKNKWPTDFWVVETKTTNNVPDDLKITKVITEQQLTSNLYYDGFNFYSPILYGLDCNGKIFRVRKKYYGSNSSDISDISWEGFSYFSEVDDVFGKPIGLWTGDSSSPLFVKTEEGWAFYSMGFSQSGLTDDMIEALRNNLSGCLLEKVNDASITSVDYLISNSSNDYDSSTITIPRSIGCKIGVEVKATNTETGEEFNQTLVSNSIIIEDPSTLPAEENRIPPYLIDDRLSLNFTEDVIESFYPTADDSSQIPENIPFVFRRPTPLYPGAKTNILGPYVINIDVDESADNIQNPSGKPYTSEIKYSLIWEHDLWEIEYDQPQFVSPEVSITRYLYAQSRLYDTLSGTTSTIRLNPVIARFYSRLLDSGKILLASIPNTDIQIDQIHGVSNNYINPVGPGVGPIVQNATLIESNRKVEKVLDFSPYKNQISLFSDVNLYSNLKLNWGGCKLKVEYSLVNEYGKTTYTKITPAPFEFLHSMNLEDEILYSNPLRIHIAPGEPGWNNDTPISVIRADTLHRVNFRYRTPTWVGWPPAYCRLKFIFDGNDDLFFYNDGGRDINKPGEIFEKQGSPDNASNFTDFAINFVAPELGEGFDGKQMTKVEIEYAYTPLPTESYQIQKFDVTPLNIFFEEN